MRDPQTAEERASVHARRNMCEVQADGSTSQAAAYQHYLAFLNSSLIRSSSGAPHDCYNAWLLWVASDAITTPFQI